ncbi:MAG: hypothetical protein CMH03_00050 [Marinovum sp.]|nr:hypothetical protein [Marinovum sp.]|tara:strand:+ start:4917 stop:5144 length:228 start_codon:yes stop_codon:yes gene_type:complete
MRILIILILLLTTGCSASLTNLFSVGSIGTAVASKNSYSIAYNVVDIGVQVETGNSIKGHAFDSFKKEETEVDDE